MASTDARPVPIKNTAFRVVFPILDADGDLVTGATGLDSEVSKDQGTFADCTNEATQIATSSGMYYLDLTSTEMNADCVSVIVKTSSSGAKTTVLVFYPEETGDINVDVTAWLGTAAATPTVAGVPEVDLTHVGGATTNVSALATNVDAILTDTADMQPKLGTPAGASISADIAAIEAQTDDIGAAGAGLTALASAANLATVAGYLDTEIAAIKAKTDNLPAAPAATGDIPSAATVADAVWDEATSGHTTAGTFGQREYVIRANTAQAGGATTITLDASASATDDIYNNQILVVTAGTGAGQSRIISDYNGTTKVATVPTWQTNPSSDSVFVILPFGAIPGASAPTAAEVADAVWDEAQADHVSAGSFGEVATEVAAILVDTGTTLQGELDGIQADTEDIQTRLPAALVSGRMDSSVGAMAANVMTAAAAAADLTTELQSGLATAANLSTVAGYLDTEIAAILADTDALEQRVTATRAGYLDNLSAGAAALESTAQSILIDTAEIGAAGAGLTNINLPDQTMNITGDITGNLSGSVGSVTGAVGSVTGAVGSVTGNVGGNVTGSVGSLATQAKADVNTEVVDALATDVIADSVPADGSRPTIAQALYLLTQFMLERKVSGTTVTVNKPDGTTALITLTLDDGASPTSITRAT